MGRKFRGEGYFGEIGRAVLELALPILCANVLQSLEGAINAAWVGHYLGDAALAGASNANMIIVVLLGGIFGIPLAATLLIGYSFGAGTIQVARRVVGTGVTVSCTLSGATAALGIVFSWTALKWLDTPVTALPLGVAYLRVALLGLPFVYLYAFVIFALRGIGDSKTPFYFLLLSAVIDLALNPVLIFGFGPISARGITGSALASVFAQSIGLGAFIAYLYWRRHPLCLRRDELSLFRIDWSIAGTLFAKGIPISILVLVGSFRELLMISLVNRFGVETTAAYGAAIQLWNYIRMPAVSIGLAVTSVAAQKIGANKWSSLQAIARVGVLHAITMTGALIVVVDILGRHAMGLFLPADSPALPIAIEINRTVSWSFVFMGVYAVIFGMMRSAGAVWTPLCIWTVVFVAWYSITAALIEHWRAEAIWWSFPASSVVTAVLAVAYYQYGNWRSANCGMSLLDNVQ